jgi:TRAP-type C4-dicarboxylate transport system permease small subunit
VASNVLMLLACGLFFQGSYAQIVINLPVKMPVTGISMAVVYATGLIFSMSAALLILHDLFRVLTGQASPQELIAIREGEDTVEAHALAAVDPPASSGRTRVHGHSPRTEAH